MASVLSVLQDPFNDRTSQFIGAGLFGYNSPATIARELFKASTDAARLLGSIKKQFFDLGEGFAWERLANLGCFFLFDQL